MDLEPVQVADQYCTNKTPLDQKCDVNLQGSVAESQSTSETRGWESTTTVGVSMEKSFSGFFASATFTFSFEQSFSYSSSWSKEKSHETSTSYSSAANIVVPPGKTYIAKLIVMKASFEIPYIMEYRYAHNEAAKSFVYGKFQDVQGHQPQVIWE
mmetsp:Transcript_26957/g.23833  ORF Transcript_26957/g.23833 Transcript_26957/m.23833 type:complete len:155 (+) Transcript_26957:674-1138(+)